MLALFYFHVSHTLIVFYAFSSVIPVEIEKSLKDFSISNRNPNIIAKN